MEAAKNKRIVTPPVVIDELLSEGIEPSGNRFVDIPNFWAAMEVISFAINSPKYLYIDAKLTWLSREKGDD